MKTLIIKFSLILSFLLLTVFQSDGKQQVLKKTLWETGEGNYKGYRIPSLIVATKGTVLAFAEGRNDGGDTGDIDVVLKRSEDNGKTWSQEQVVWNDELNTCGNPCPVVDSETGRIWLWTTCFLYFLIKNYIIKLFNILLQFSSDQRFERSIF